ncbi:hypothetical protein KFU94_04960 [Chloroflexi bacterium TSY]|nr:hypothetical protein [Chloroflexi bacterium TSY]
MKRIAVQVTDEQKAELLLELLSALDFVQEVKIEETNGISNGTHKTRGFPTPAVSPQRPAMLNEQAAFDAMQDDLIEKYLGQYVAIFQGKVIDHDTDEIALVKRKMKSHPDDVVLIKQVRDTPDPVLYFRSPRFVQR